LAVAKFIIYAGKPLRRSPPPTGDNLGFSYFSALLKQASIGKRHLFQPPEETAPELCNVQEQAFLSEFS
jgi:hypothetical protein